MRESGALLYDENTQGRMILANENPQRRGLSRLYSEPVYLVARPNAMKSAPTKGVGARTSTLDLGRRSARVSNKCNLHVLNDEGHLACRIERALSSSNPAQELQQTREANRGKQPHRTRSDRLPRVQNCDGKLTRGDDRGGGHSGRTGGCEVQNHEEHTYTPSGGIPVERRGISAARRCGF